MSEVFLLLAWFLLLWGVVAFRGMWLSQNRWVVWTPEGPEYWYLREKLWETPVDKRMANRYAELLDGKVYRVR